MKKLSLLKTAKFRFHFDEITGEPDLHSFGHYRMGLTTGEIEDYLRVRSGKSRVDSLLKKFYDIAGVNTMACQECEKCGDSFGLMYRWDVERFAEQLFNGTPTYWD